MATSLDIQQNFLTPTNFRFTIKRLPHVTFFCQSATIPGLSFSPVEIPTPFKSLYREGGPLDIGTFTVTVLVDEDMNNYLEIYNWMLGLTFPNKFEEYANLLEGDGLYSDATLHIMSNAKNPNLYVSLKDIFPISMGDISMSVNQTDVQPAQFDISFQVNSFTVTAN